MPESVGKGIEAILEKESKSEGVIHNFLKGKYLGDEDILKKYLEIAYSRLKALENSESSKNYPETYEGSILMMECGDCDPNSVKYIIFDSGEKVPMILYEDSLSNYLGKHVKITLNLTGPGGRIYKETIEEVGAPEEKKMHATSISIPYFNYLQLLEDDFKKKAIAEAIGADRVGFQKFKEELYKINSI
ncbi:MAG: hypothetical protein JW727_05650 [Candidatus Aenigmarchaeota archaeon]|nr:hypothetical protein [Candidatus Aenigmarchaeota archaeon]